MALEVIARPFGEHPVSTLLALEPHPLVYVPLRVDHTPFPVRKVVQPSTVVSVTVLEELRTTPSFTVFSPVTSVFFP